MTKKKVTPHGIVTDRVEYLLALILIQGMKPKRAAILLSRAGFSNLEIADLMNKYTSEIAELIFGKAEKEAL